MADIVYWGLTSTKGMVTIADTSTATIDDLITAVAADEGLPTDYYQLSKSTDPSNTLSSVVGDSTLPPTLDDLGIGDGDTVYSTTNQVGTKEDRQIQKLDIAAAKRSEAYDIDKLPTKYSGNTVVDNANTGGLQERRPWIIDYSRVMEGLVFFLDAGDTDSYPGTGTTWTDIVSSTSTTLTGAPTYTSPTGFTFNGTTQYARIPNVNDVTNFTNTDAYTVEVWFNPAAGQPSPTLSTVLEKWNSTNQNRYPYVMRYAENTGTLGFNVYDGTNNPGATLTGFTTGSWHQAVGVFDFPSGTITPYRNGSPGSTASLAGVGQVSNTSQVGIANRINPSSAAQFLFKGSIGIISIYNRALTSAEVLTNYQSNKSRFGL